MKLPIRLGLALLVSLPGAGCGADAAGDSAAFAVRDSAGIQIAESAGPAWGDGEGWRLSAEPILQIGDAEGAPQYLLSGVRSVRRTGTGEIVVANSASHEVRHYSPDGSYLRGYGRQGGGPGEFQGLDWLQVMGGDSVQAYDFQARRISVFSPAGEFARATTVGAEITPTEGFPQILGVLDDGSHVVRVIAFGDEPSGDGVQHQKLSILHFSSSGELIDTIAVPPPLEIHQMSQDMGGGRTIMMMMSPIFGRQQVAAVAGEKIILGSNESYRIDVHSPQALERSIRVRSEPRPVTEAMLASHEQERRERQAAQNPDMQPALDRAREQLPHAATLPFYSRLLGDDAGNLWVQRYRVPGEPDPGWAVFDPEGRLLGTVGLPEDFALMHVGEDYVLGVWRDELDVERVRMYALEKR